MLSFPVWLTVLAHSVMLPSPLQPSPLQCSVRLTSLPRPCLLLSLLLHHVPHLTLQVDLVCCNYYGWESRMLYIDHPPLGHLHQLHSSDCILGMVAEWPWSDCKIAILCSAVASEPADKLHLLHQILLCLLYRSELALLLASASRLKALRSRSVLFLLQADPSEQQPKQIRNRWCESTTPDLKPSPELSQLIVVQRLWLIYC